MDIRIKAIHFDVNERLQDFIEKKVSKLGRFESEIGKVEVSLKVVKPESAMESAPTGHGTIRRGRFHIGPFDPRG